MMTMLMLKYTRNSTLRSKGGVDSSSYPCGG